MDFVDIKEQICCTKNLCGQDEGIVAINIVCDGLVDSFTTMAQNSVIPDCIENDDNNEGDDMSKLTLAYENLYDVPKTIAERFSDHVKYLDLSHNKITNLDALVYFKHLTSLIADDNPITENCVLPPLPKLELLWLNRCKIAELYPWVGKLKDSCPNIQYLSLMGNPAAPSFLNGGTFYENLQYRLFVISQFSYLTYLDDRKVTDDQIEESQRLYKRPFFDRIIRPSSSSLSQFVNAPVSWNKITKTLWGKDKRERRNLLI